MCVYRPLAWLLAPPLLLQKGLRKYSISYLVQRLKACEAIAQVKPNKTRVLISAVSIGELRGVQGLIRQLHRLGTFETILQLDTPSALCIAQSQVSHETLHLRLGNADLFPLRQLEQKRLAPHLLIICGNTLWPEQLHAASERKTPIVLINAQLNRTAEKRLRKLSKLTHYPWNKILKIFTTSETQTQKYLQLGIPNEKIITTADLKNETPIPHLHETELLQLKTHLGLQANHLALVAYSIWQQETTHLLHSLQQALQKKLPIKLILIPRHLHSLPRFIAHIQQAKLTYQLYHRNSPPNPACPITLINTFGKTQHILQTATIAFAGKSLPPHTQGQNPLEAIRLNKPLVYGPGMDHFKDTCKELEKHQLTQKNTNIAHTQTHLLHLLQHPLERQKLQKKMQTWNASHPPHAPTIAATLHTLAHPTPPHTPPRAGTPHT